MKIFSLCLKNFNFLKGEWKIDFIVELFVSNGLFVIIGVIGVGKIMLFDVICLVFYYEMLCLNKVFQL